MEVLVILLSQDDLIGLWAQNPVKWYITNTVYAANTGIWTVSLN